MSGIVRIDRKMSKSHLIALFECIQDGRLELPLAFYAIYRTRQKQPWNADIVFGVTEKKWVWSVARRTDHEARFSKRWYFSQEGPIEKALKIFRKSQARTAGRALEKLTQVNGHGLGNFTDYVGLVSALRTKARQTAYKELFAFGVGAPPKIRLLDWDEDSKSINFVLL